MKNSDRSEREGSGARNLAGWLGAGLLALLPACGSTPEPEPPVRPPPESSSPLAKVEFGESRALFAAYEERIRQAGPADLVGIEAELISVLRTPGSTLASRQFACRMLRRVGSVQTVPALAALLDDPRLAHLARFALQGMASPEVDLALRHALTVLDGELRIGVIDTIGERGDLQAVPELAALLREDDPATVRAALTALGRIGGPVADLALAAAKVEGDLHAVQLDARLQCADSILAAGDSLKAIEIHTELRRPENPLPVRLAAWRGTLRSTPDFAISAPLIDLFTDPNPALPEAAARFLIELPEESAVFPLVGRVSTFEPRARALAIGALAVRGEPSVAPAAVEALDSADLELRLAGLEALGFVGDASHVKHLARFAARGGPEAEAALASLARLDEPAVEPAILECLETESPAVVAAMIPCLVAREYAEAVPTLFELSLDPDAAVRRAAIRGLESLAGPEQLPALLEVLDQLSNDYLLGALTDDVDRRLLEATVLAACRRSADQAGAVALVAGALEGQTPLATASLLRVLGGMPGPESLAPLVEATSHAQVVVRGAALESLARWPDGTPTETLRRASRWDEDSSLRLLALEGYLRLIAASEERTPDLKRTAYQRSFAAALTTEEELMVLRCAGRFGGGWAVGFLESFREDEQLAAAAAPIQEELCARLAREVSHAAQGCSVQLAVAPVERYRAGGPAALADGEWGSTNLRDGRWHGFQGDDLDALVDLERTLEIRDLRVGFLRDQNSWIFPPPEVEFWLSMNGEEFTSVGTIGVPPVTMGEEPALGDATVRVDRVRARYVRVVARNTGELPDWHSGSGEKAWLFIDEIQVNANYEE